VGWGSGGALDGRSPFAFAEPNRSTPPWTAAPGNDSKPRGGGFIRGDSWAPGAEGGCPAVQAVYERANRVRSASRGARSKKGGSTTGSNGSGPNFGS